MSYYEAGSWLRAHPPSLKAMAGQGVQGKSRKKGLDFSYIPIKIIIYSIRKRYLMTEEKKDSMTSLKDILQGLLSGSNLKFNPADAEIWEVWDDVVGPAIAEHAQPSNIKKKLLRVHVAESIWLQELEFVADTIKEKLNERLGRNAVEKVIFRLGSL